MRLNKSRKGSVTRLLMAGAAGATLLVAGCTVRQPSEPVMPPSVEVPDTWNSQSEEKARNLPAGWLADFGDPRLEAIVTEALENNQDLQTAAAQLEVARQAAIKAGAGLYPFISAGAGGSSEGGYDGGDTTTTSGVSLDVVWEVDLWGRRLDSRTTRPPVHNTLLPVSRWLRRRPKPGSWLSKVKCR